VIELAKLDAHNYVRKENAAALALTARMKCRQATFFVGSLLTKPGKPTKEEACY